ncbi:hypothetical protein [Mesorhizobium sp. M0276]|uniref:hypothetical protein n=1 Tax=Mesorhizobium sp. M0276 TaxID=2956928 RepID=UPI0033397C4D
MIVIVDASAIGNLRGAIDGIERTSSSITLSARIDPLNARSSPQSFNRRPFIGFHGHPCGVKSFSDLSVFIPSSREEWRHHRARP